jgi:hypothetical protein
LERIPAGVTYEYLVKGTVQAIVSQNKAAPKTTNRTPIRVNGDKIPDLEDVPQPINAFLADWKVFIGLEVADVEKLMEEINSKSIKSKAEAENI